MNEAAESEDLNEDIKDDAPEISGAESKAREGGWKPEDEWEGEDDKKPQEFISAEMFNERGVWIQRHKDQQKRIDEMEQSFNTRMDSANKLRDKQIELQKSDLVRKRDDAIDQADKDTANRIQDDLDKLNVQPEPEVNSADTRQEETLNTWNQTNSWIFQPGPKTAYAQSQLNSYTNQGMTVENALANVDWDIAREFPAVNTGGNNQPRSEGGSKPGGKRSTGKLSMTDLDETEKRIWKISGNSWKSEADFLQSVQDVRKES